MDDVEKLQQMNDVERMREIKDVISNNIRTYARAMLTAGVLNCSIMYCESMPCLI